MSKVTGIKIIDEFIPKYNLDSDEYVDFYSSVYDEAESISGNNIWIPRKGKTQWSTSYGITYRITAGGYLEIYGTCTTNSTIALTNSSDVITLKANTVYSMTSKYLGSDLVAEISTLEGCTYTENEDKTIIIITVGDSDINFVTNLAPKFRLIKDKNYGTSELDCTRYKCLLVEGDYTDYNSLTFFTYYGTLQDAISQTNPIDYYGSVISYTLDDIRILRLTSDIYITSAVTFVTDELILDLNGYTINIDGYDKFFPPVNSKILIYGMKSGSEVVDVYDSSTAVTGTHYFIRTDGQFLGLYGGNYSFTIKGEGTANLASGGSILLLSKYSLLRNMSIKTVCEAGTAAIRSVVSLRINSAPSTQPENVYVRMVSCNIDCMSDRDIGGGSSGNLCAAVNINKGIDTVIFENCNIHSELSELSSDTPSGNNVVAVIGLITTSNATADGGLKFKDCNISSISKATMSDQSKSTWTLGVNDSGNSPYNSIYFDNCYIYGTDIAALSYNHSYYFNNCVLKSPVSCISTQASSVLPEVRINSSKLIKSDAGQDEVIGKNTVALISQFDNGVISLAGTNQTSGYPNIYINDSEIIADSLAYNVDLIDIDAPSSYSRQGHIYLSNIKCSNRFKISSINDTQITIGKDGSGYIELVPGTYTKTEDVYDTEPPAEIVNPVSAYLDPPTLADKLKSSINSLNGLQRRVNSKNEDVGNGVSLLNSLVHEISSDVSEIYCEKFTVGSQDYLGDIEVVAPFDIKKVYIVADDLLENAVPDSTVDGDTSNSRFKIICLVINTVSGWYFETAGGGDGTSVSNPLMVAYRTTKNSTTNVWDWSNPKFFASSFTALSSNPIYTINNNVFRFSSSAVNKMLSFSAGATYSVYIIGNNNSIVEGQFDVDSVTESVTIPLPDNYVLDKLVIDNGPLSLRKRTLYTSGRNVLVLVDNLSNNSKVAGMSASSVANGLEYSESQVQVVPSILLSGKLKPQNEILVKLIVKFDVSWETATASEITVYIDGSAYPIQSGWTSATLTFGSDKRIPTIQEIETAFSTAGISNVSVSENASNYKFYPSSISGCKYNYYISGHYVDNLEKNFIGVWTPAEDTTVFDYQEVFGDKLQFSPRGFTIYADSNPSTSSASIKYILSISSSRAVAQQNANSTMINYVTYESMMVYKRSFIGLPLFIRCPYGNLRIDNSLNTTNSGGSMFKAGRSYRIIICG